MTSATGVAWIALGANVGHREAAVSTMRGSLDREPLRVAAASRELVTRPIGVREQPDYLNQVLRVVSTQPLGAEEWLDRCRAAEAAAGRRPTYRWGPRRGDADILLLGEHGELRVALPLLVVPHPELSNRAFACALLAELAPDLRHPDGWLIADHAGIFKSAGGPPTVG